MIFKIPARTVPEYHFGAAGTLSLNSSVLLHSMSQQAELSDCFSIPCFLIALSGNPRIALRITLVRDSAEADLLPLILGQNKTTSSLKERNPYSATPLGPSAEHPHYIFVLPAPLNES